MSTYLFTHHHFSGETYTPQLVLQADQSLTHLPLSNEAKTLAFDTNTRFCTGWHNLETGESHPCPDNAALESKFHECRHCQLKTGFNPAFYNADSVSEQQQKRNAQPHILYLAHFGPGVVKVGISYQGRGIRRLLDQGARSYLLLGTFPNADIARQYEAKIARLSGIAETIQSRQKSQLINREYHPQTGVEELLATRERIAKDIGLTPDEHQPEHLHRYYLGDRSLQAGQLIDLTPEQKISGTFLGMIGSYLIAEQENTQYMLNLSKLRGYKVAIGEEEPNQHAPQQASLF